MSRVTPLRLRSAASLALVVVALAAALYVLRRKATSDPDVVFLPRDSRAEWITYASPPSIVARPGAQLETVFTRDFLLERVEPPATLVARFQRQGVVTVNGKAVAFEEGDESEWKRARTADVTALLRPGRNEVSASVLSSFGPPALWLAFEGSGREWSTNGSWRASHAGATVLPARLATTPMSEWSFRSDRSETLRDRASRRAPGAVSGLLRSAPTLALLAALSAALVIGGGAFLRRGAARRPDSWPPFTPRLSFLVSIAAAAAFWVPLFVHNRGLTARAGFDARSHTDYVQYILDRGALPLANEGWAMYQPPLYYALAAGVAKLSGHDVANPDAVPAIRWIGLVAGILQTGFVVASTRLLFPGRPGPALAAFLLAAFLPMQLYLHQYVTNEGLAALFVTAAVYLAIRVMTSDDRTFRSHAILGAVLGLALLAKFSALIALVAIASVLVARLALRGVRDAGTFARTLGALAASCVLVSGWHFLRVAIRFGNPFIGNWDPASGFAWWQDPGYRVAGDYARFGEALAQPLFSAARSVPDALYSTLFGDGLVGGRNVTGPWPPWDYDLMAAGTILALLPALLIAAGALVAATRLVREPRAEWFLLLGQLFLTGFGFLAMTLDVPSYAQAKAFYGSAALVPLCAVGAIGFDLLASRSRALGSISLGALVLFALTSYASYWSTGGNAEASPPTAASGENAASHHARALAAHESGDADGAYAAAMRALEIDPEHTPALLLVAVVSFGRGEPDAAFAAAREALRVRPYDPALHAFLGQIHRAVGEPALALERYETAARLGSVDPDVERSIGELHLDLSR